MGNCACITKKTKPKQTLTPLQTTFNQNGSNNNRPFPQHGVSEPLSNPGTVCVNTINAGPIQPYAFGVANSTMLSVPPQGPLQLSQPALPNSIVQIPPPQSLPPVKQIRVRALYTYTGQHQDDLPFRKGDTMFVSDVSAQWWLARHQKTGATGYIPSNYVLIDDGLPTSLDAWYDISRREADKRLLRVGNPKGTYLIRSSSETQNYALSVRHYDQERNIYVVKHYRIRVLDNDNGYFISNRITFPNIKDLISYYSRTAEGLCCRLTVPCPRDYRPPVQFRDFEVNRNSITMVRQLGHGSFGEVYLAKWNDSVEVAVKMRLSHTDRTKFIEEARLMHEFHHPRIVQLLGVCTQPEDEPVYIITELMAKGALVDFLRGDEGQQLSLSDLIDMMAQIASGMTCLEERNSVHRDLRAANILVDSDNSVKVSDFGLAKIISDDAQADHSTKFPIKWTAPEAALQHIFSIKSDVWSFGVLMYEIVTYGGTPYPGMSTRQTIVEVDKGYRLPNPHTANHPCPDDLYNIMLKCWDVRPENRPTFRSLYDVFDNWASHVETQYFDN
ncbi:Tyrosine-protein kinase hck [Clonorchis sinensis]|uniref:Tyrosine-protein kinase n=1 Tax=Clonorchis sinensis TaxID=79923 RepID=A0A8T1M6A0_CLOSI|nr:Tyrosine-protein kinase hck [Clonorchis sinensis]